MKRVNRPAIAAGVASALAVAVVLAPAALSRVGHATASGVTVKCKTALATRVPNGSTQVIPGQHHGAQFGEETCGAPLGSGVESGDFTYQPGGDYTGGYTKWTHTGTISVKFDLTPQESGFQFSSSDFAGTLTITGGTGAFTGAHGRGTSSCHSPDGVHETCKEKLTISGIRAG